MDGAALPSWITYTSSGTYIQQVQFDPTYAELGTHTVMATFTPLFGDPVRYAAFEITVECQVTGFMLPTAPVGT